MFQMKYLTLFWLILAETSRALAPSASPPLHWHLAAPNSNSSKRRRGLAFTHRSSLERDFIEPDYLITDSIDIEDRATFFETAVTRPTILLRILLIVVGTGISISNIVGNYNDFYLSLEAVAIPLGLLTAAADYKASIPPYSSVPANSVSPNFRLGTADDSLIHLYAAIYTAGATWLALRVGPFCPSWVATLDPVFGLSAASIFLFSLLAPVVTLLHHSGLVDAEDLLRQIVSIARKERAVSQPLPPLTDTEQLRAKSLIAVGVVGCLFMPIAIKFAIAGDGWWVRVLKQYPAQGTLESSTALFGVFATQASMIAHTVAKAGVAPFSIVAPAFAVVCFILAIVPCVCSLYWLGNDISFFSQYTL